MYIFSSNKYERDFKNIEEIAKYLYTGVKPITGHISIGQYTQEIVEYKASNNGSVADYQGPVNGHLIPLDADLIIDRIVNEAKARDISTGEMFNTALKEMLIIWSPIFSEWDNEGIEFYVFYSGNKGISIYISKAYFANTDKFNQSFHLLCKAVVYSLKRKYPTLQNDIFVLDTQPYHRTGMLRAPFSLHEKTDKTKYMLQPIVKGQHGLLDKYNTIGRDWKADKDKYTQILIQMYTEKPESDKKICFIEEQYSMIEPVTVNTSKYDKPFMMESCIWEMWKNGRVSTTGRQPTMRILASWCAKRRFSAETTASILNEMNRNIQGKGPLPSLEVNAILKRYEKYYYNFCKNEICLELCPKTKECPYYEPSRGVQGIHTPQEGIEALEEYDNADKSRVIRWDSLFPGLQGELNPIFGHIGTLAGASGTGKTQVALQLALANRHVNWIFWSYEMPEVELMARCRKILGLTNNPDWKEILLEKTKHIFFIRNGNICMQDQIIMKRQIEMIHNVKVSAMISDYIGIIPVRNLDTGKIMHSEADSVPAAAKIIKDNAVSEQIVHIVTCQPTKEYSAHGAVLLEPEHVKQGQSIQSMSDSQVTICKPNMLKDNDCLCAFETKNREGGNRSTSVVKLKDNYIIIPELYDKPYTLFRTVDEWLKSASK